MPDRQTEGQASGLRRPLPRKVERHFPLPRPIMREASALDLDRASLEAGMEVRTWSLLPTARDEIRDQ
jgi:hypothetical protein